MQQRRPPQSPRNRRARGGAAGPMSRTRRRWPRAYDGAEPTSAPEGRRRWRGAERRQTAGQVPGVTKPRALDTLRQAPVRNGLIGLAVAGMAAPIAVSQYQQALRTDPAHEHVVPDLAANEMPMGQQGVNEVWAEMEAEQLAVQDEREAVIEENLERYASYSLSRELAEKIYDAATENDVDPNTAFGLVRAESSFRNQATSRVGATGLTQLMPRTAAGLQPGVTPQQLRNPDVNLRLGFKYLNQMIKKYNGDEKLALIAYNRGPGTVDRALRQGKNPDNGYADFVAGKANHGHKLFTNR
jgi:soluble lytic murein transglycosylase-like protein